MRVTINNESTNKQLEIIQKYTDYNTDTSICVDAIKMFYDSVIADLSLKLRKDKIELEK